MVVDLGTRRLRYFIAVAEELSFTRAATRVFVAQQALSQQIRQLERDLGVRLLERSSRHVALTPAGAALLEEARQLVAAADSAVERVRRTEAETPNVLRLGFVADGMREAVRAVLASFEQAYPKVEVQLVEHSWQDPYVGLRSGACDAGIVTLPSDLASLESVPVGTWPPCVVQSKTQPLTSAGSLSADDLRSMPTVWYDVPGSSFYTRWNVGEPTVRAQTTLAWIAAVATGRGVGVLSSAVRDLYALPGFQYALPDFDYLPVTGLPDITLAIAARADDPDPLVRGLLRHARAQVRGV
jgi:DNA-binding transcriptional LysR family regulator